MPNYVGMKIGDISARLAGQQLTPKKLQSTFDRNGNNLQSVDPRHPINTKIQKRVNNLDGFGSRASFKRPIKTTAGKP